MTVPINLQHLKKTQQQTRKCVKNIYYMIDSFSISHIVISIWDFYTKTDSKNLFFY